MGAANQRWRISDAWSGAGEGPGRGNPPFDVRARKTAVTLASRKLRHPGCAATLLPAVV